MLYLKKQHAMAWRFQITTLFFSCCYANSGQLYRDRKKYFLRLLLAISVPYLFSFVFVIMASNLFHEFFEKRKKASL